MLIEILLGTLVLIELVNTLLRVIKLFPPDDPPIDEEVRRRMYS